MKTTVTEEFDADGTLVKRTTVTEGAPASGGYVWPSGGSVLPASRCTCGFWSSVMPPPPCPVHGQSMVPTITVNTSSNTTPEQIAERLGMELRRIA